jgi:peptidoglycan/LPS O-acetylase OafA/YrhL
LSRDFDATVGRQIFRTSLLLLVVLFIVKLAYAHKIVTTGTWAFTYTPGFWADYLAPPVLFLAVMSMRHAAWPALFSRLARYSFGIYLVHPVVMDLVEIIITPWGLHPWQMVFVKFSLALSGTLALVLAISCLPFLAWTIGLGGGSRRRDTASPPAMASSGASA